LDFQGSTKEFERAIALDPNYATAHHWYGLGPLRCIGNFDKAIAELNRALRLDPFSLIINADLGVGSMTARRYAEAIVQLRKAIDYLERDYRDHADYELALIKVDPMLDPLRGDPRFEALVSKVFAPKGN